MASGAELALILTGKDQSASAALMKVSDHAGKLGDHLAGIGKIAAGVALGGGLLQLPGAIAGMAQGMISGNAQMETYQSQLETLMGSADAAKERIAQLAKIGADTPFELPQLVASEKILMGFGLTADKTMALTGKSLDQFRTSIGDMAAGTGTDLSELTNLWGKFGSGATGEAISRLQELGIVTREQLAEMGVQFSKSGELTSPLPQAMAAAMQIADSKFGGGMAKLSQTFEGQMSTLSDTFNQAKIAIMAPIFDVVKESLTGLNATLSSGGFQEALKSVAALMAGGVKAGVEGLKGALATLQPALEVARDAFLTIQQVFAGDWAPSSDGIDPFVNAIGILAIIARDQVLPALGALAGFIGDNFQAIMTGAAAIILAVAVPAFIAWATAAGAAAVATIAALAPVLIPLALIGAAAAALYLAWQTNFLGIQDATAAVWGFIQPIIQAIITEVGRFTTEMLPLAAAAWDAIQNKINEVMPAITSLVTTGLGVITSIWSVQWEAIKAVLGVVWEAIVTVVRVQWDILSGVIKAFLQVLQGDWSGAWDTIKQTVVNVWTDLVSGASSAGEGLVNAFRDGIMSKLEVVKSAVGEMAAAIRALLPHSDADEGPLSDIIAAGAALPIALAEGIASTTGMAVGAVDSMAERLIGAIAPAVEKAFGDAGASLPAALASGVSANTALTTAHKEAATWAEKMAQEEAALAQVLAQQAPPLRLTSDAMTQFGSLLGPIMREVASGSISVRELDTKMVDLARAVGLTDKPWQELTSGQVESYTAMEHLIRIASDAGPQFDDLRHYLDEAGSSSNEASLRFLQMAAAFVRGGGQVEGAAHQLGQAIPTAIAKGVDQTAGKFSQAIRRMGDQAMRAFERGNMGEILDIFHVNMPPLQGRALGGSVLAGQSYIVGERGPEILHMGSGGGYVSPNYRSPRGGGGDTYVTVNMPNYIGDIRTVTRAVRDELLRMQFRNRLGFGD